MKNVNYTSKVCKCKLQARPRRVQMLSLMHYLQVQTLVPCLVLHNYSNSRGTILRSNTFECVGQPATSQTSGMLRTIFGKSTKKTAEWFHPVRPLDQVTPAHQGLSPDMWGARGSLENQSFLSRGLLPGNGDSHCGLYRFCGELFPKLLQHFT